LATNQTISATKDCDNASVAVIKIDLQPRDTNVDTMEDRTENLRRSESESDSVLASENESIQIPEIPSRKQKSYIDAVVDEGLGVLIENFM